MTREGIDERLRILESVSARAALCVEDLLRVRSALPPLQVQGHAGSRQGGGGRGGQGVSTSVEVQVDGNAAVTAVTAADSTPVTATATTADSTPVTADSTAPTATTLTPGDTNINPEAQVDDVL